MTLYLESLKVPAWALIVVAGVSYGIVALVAWWPRWKAAWAAFAHVPTETNPDTNAIELLLYFNEQANEAIVTLRDKQGNAVGEDLGRFRDFVISVGRWAGRNEYLAAKLKKSFPNEVSTFEVYGGDDIQYQAPTGYPIQTLTNHLQAVLTKKVERLRALTTAMQNAHPRK